MTPKKEPQPTMENLEFVQPVHVGAGPIGLVESPTPESIAAAEALAATAATRRVCNEEGCSNFIAIDAHANTKKCPDHFVGVAGKARKGPRDKAPNVTIKMPAATKADKKDTAAQTVAEGAEAMLSFIPLGLGMMGDAQCAAMWRGQLPMICQQIGKLSEFHPGMAKLFAPVSGTGEGAAWFGLFMSLSPVIIATLSHHGLMPEKMMEGIAAAMVGAAADADPAS